MVTMGAIPADWLIGLTPVQEVECWLAEEGAPDLWLVQWRAFLGRMGPGDELWEYRAVVTDDPASDGFDLCDLRVGYARVRGGEALETISTEWY
jgi:hypothetical protein